MRFEDRHDDEEIGRTSVIVEKALSIKEKMRKYFVSVYFRRRGKGNVHCIQQ
jgi:hypothetical protein